MTEARTFDHYATSAKDICRASKAIPTECALIPNNVGMMRRLKSKSSGDQSIESDSDKTSGFSAPNSSVEKRLAISDELAGARQKWVVIWRSEKTAGNPRPM